MPPRSLPARLRAVLAATSAAASLAAAAAATTDDALLNAYAASLATLTAPRAHYFLEFPLPPEDPLDPGTPAAPRCEDGSAYSFLFRRGTDAHASKLLVEFAGPGEARAAPWRAFQRSRASSLFGDLEEAPPLGSCTGVSSGFLALGAGLGLLGEGDADDAPLVLRAAGRKNATAPSDAWWSRLGGGGASDVRDWSHLLAPHCASSSPALAAANARAVAGWVARLRDRPGGGGGGGPAALAAVAGGSGVGCGDEAAVARGVGAGRLALAFARDVAAAGGTGGAGRALVVVDGAALTRDGAAPAMAEEDAAPSDPVDLVRDALSAGVDVAWLARGAASRAEDALREDAEAGRFGGALHVHRTSLAAGDDGAEGRAAAAATCPLYALPDRAAAEEDAGLADFLGGVVADRMAWGRDGADGAAAATAATNDGSARLSYLSIFLLLLGSYLLSWAVHLLLKLRRRRRASVQDDADAAADAVPSPHDLWFRALTRFPVLFLLASIAVPVALSAAAYAREADAGGLRVNLDFDSYLDIDTPQERTTKQYKALLEYQTASLKEERAHCDRLGDATATAFDDDDAARAAPADAGAARRRLQDYGRRNGRTVVSFFYQARDGGNVFAPKVLEAIRDFERFLLEEVPDLPDYCYGDGEGTCHPFNSIAPYFFPDGETLVDDVDRVLRSFPGSKIALAKMDKVRGGRGVARVPSMGCMLVQRTLYL